MIVLDTSFLIGFYNQRDTHHSAARVLMEQLLAGEWGGGLLLEYVFLEMSTVLLVRRDLRSINTRRQAPSGGRRAGVHPLFGSLRGNA